MRDQGWWIRAYQDLDALWIHDGNMLRPHALLTSGLHSNGFFNSKLVIGHASLLDEAAGDLLRRLAQAGATLSDIEHVVGPQTGATLLAELMGKRLSRPWSSPAKSGTGEGKAMVFTSEEAARVRGMKALLCEDVLTTGGSVLLTAKAIAEAGGKLLPFVTTLVNRSGMPSVDGREVIALIDYSMPMWEPERCPLCKEGSEAIRPKKDDNWKKLNAAY